MKLKDGFDLNVLNEDVSFLSNNHISPIFSNVLDRKECFPIAELNTFRFLNARLKGHPAIHEGLEGIRIASGSMIQGRSVLIGTALSK